MRAHQRGGRGRSIYPLGAPKWMASQVWGSTRFAMIGRVFPGPCQANPECHPELTPTLRNAWVPKDGPSDLHATAHRLHRTPSNLSPGEPFCLSEHQFRRRSAYSLESRVAIHGVGRRLVVWSGKTSVTWGPLGAQLSSCLMGPGGKETLFLQHDLVPKSRDACRPRH